MSTAISRASEFWGNKMPDWIRVLAEACDERSQKKVADELDYSPSVVNQVLGNKYIGGDLNTVQLAVEGVFMNRKVHCPVLDEMSSNDCLQHQKAIFAATSHVRVRLYKACRAGCQHSRIGR